MNLFWILLFGSFNAVNDAPVKLNAGANEIQLRRPISAINSGAMLQIDISSNIPKSDLTLDLSEKWIEKNIKKGCFKAVLRGPGAPATTLEFGGALAFSPGKVFLTLVSRTGVVEKKYFKSLTLHSCKSMNNVDIYWQNYKL